MMKPPSPLINSLSLPKWTEFALTILFTLTLSSCNQDTSQPPNSPDGNQLETTEPETTEPETTEPETTEPETTEPETTEPETAEPETTEPETAEPETTEPESTGLQAYLERIDFGASGDNLWRQPTQAELTLTDQVIQQLSKHHFAEAHNKATQLNGSVIEFKDQSATDTKHYYIFHIDSAPLNEDPDSERFQALGGTYVYFPEGKNIVIQVPHPKHDRHTHQQGIQTFLGMEAKYLLISGTHRNSATQNSTCQPEFKQSDASHNDQHHFFQVHKTLSTLDSNTLFIELHGFGETTQQKLNAQCATTDSELLVNLSNGQADVHQSDANRFMQLLHQKITQDSLIHSCLYSPEQYQSSQDHYSLSLGGTLNVAGRFTNGSEAVCQQAAPVATGRFLHLEQSEQVREFHQKNLLSYLNSAWSNYQNRDDDADQLPDEWEVQYQLNAHNAEDASTDPDQDNLTNLEEYLLGSNPLVADHGRLPHYSIYWDDLDNEWQDFSPTPQWQPHLGDASQVNQALYALDRQSSTIPAHSGRYALALNPDRWRFLNIAHENLKVDAWQRFEFYVHGGKTGGQKLQVQFKGSSLINKPDLTQVTINDYIEGGQVFPNQWHKVSIPLSDLLDASQVISHIRIGWLSGFDQAKLVYLDSIRFVAETDPAPDLLIDIDTTRSIGELSQDLFGLNGAHWMTNIHHDPVATHINQLGKGVIRYPGGSSSDTFDWLENNTQAPDWQTTTDEYLELLEKTGANGMITTNFGSGTAQQAADWVAHTQSKGVDITWWEIGNEIYGDWETTWTHDGTHYMEGDETHDGANEFCKAIKAVKPDAQVSMVGTITEEEADHFSSKALASASDCFDYYSLHYYALGPGRHNYSGLLSAPTSDLPIIGNTLNDLLNRRETTKHLKLALTEYNSYYTAPEALAVQTVNMLFMADMIGQAAMQGISVANAWSLGVTPHNPPGTRYGLLQDYLELTRQPSYYIYPLWTKSGDQLLQTSVNRFASRELAVYASKHSDSGNITLIVINKSGQVQQGKINLTGLGQIKKIEINHVKGESLNAETVYYNGITNPPIDLSQLPPQVITEQDSNQFSYQFPPYSVNQLMIYPQ